MANPALLNQILSQEPVTYPWAHQCLLRLKDSSFNWTHGLVDGAGHPTSRLLKSTWGIVSLQISQDLKMKYLQRRSLAAKEFE